MMVVTSFCTVDVRELYTLSSTLSVPCAVKSQRTEAGTED